MCLVSPRTSMFPVLCLLVVTAPHESAGQGSVFKTGVEMVALTVTVTDANGQCVSGLSADDFAVFARRVELRAQHGDVMPCHLRACKPPRIEFGSGLMARQKIVNRVKNVHRRVPPAVYSRRPPRRLPSRARARTRQTSLSMRHASRVTDSCDSGR